MEINEKVKIVLSHPQDGQNIGSVCRAMKTMGITKLCIVGDGTYEEERVKTLSVHAYDIYENAERVSTLKEALLSSSLSIATTRRKGKFRKLRVFNPEEISKQINNSEGLVSIVFGRESDGLRDDEVNECGEICTIPTSVLFPSLNLSQAVQIICYEIFKNNNKYKDERIGVNKERVECAKNNISSSLENIGYYKRDDEKKWTEIFISNIIERAMMSEREVKKLEDIFEKAEKISRFKEKK